MSSPSQQMHLTPSAAHSMYRELQQRTEDRLKNHLPTDPVTHTNKTFRIQRPDPDKVIILTSMELGCPTHEPYGALYPVTRTGAGQIGCGVAIACFGAHRGIIIPYGFGKCDRNEGTAVIECTDTGSIHPIHIITDYRRVYWTMKPLQISSELDLHRPFFFF
jgi:hypothetical protein